jgi:hypothetical protein
MKAPITIASSERESINIRCGFVGNDREDSQSSKRVGPMQVVELPVSVVPQNPVCPSLSRSNDMKATAEHVVGVQQVTV